MVVIGTTDYQGVSLTEAYDNRTVMAQIARIKDRLTAVEQNVDPTLRTDLEAAVAELEALETTVSGVQTQVDGNAEAIEQVQANVETLDGEVETALTTKADKTELTDGSVTKVGTADVGTATLPVYLAEGAPTACDDRFILSHTSGGTENKGKSIWLVGTSAAPYVKMENDEIWAYATSSVGVRLMLTGSKATMTYYPGSCYTCLDAERALIRAKTHYTERLAKGAMVSGKPWTVVLKCSGEASACETVIVTPDGMAKLAIYNTGAMNSTPKVKVVYNDIAGMSVVSSSNKTSNSNNDVYVAFATQYPADSVTVHTVNVFGVKDVPANPTCGLPTSVNYEDVVYDGIHIPNITNYAASYVWQTVI